MGSKRHENTKYNDDCRPPPRIMAGDPILPPRHCLWNMSGVNRTFYALVLPETFRQLDLAHSNTRAMSHLNKWLM